MSGMETTNGREGQDCFLFQAFLPKKIIGGFFGIDHLQKRNFCSTYNVRVDAPRGPRGKDAFLPQLRGTRGHAICQRSSGGPPNLHTTKGPVVACAQGATADPNATGA